MNLYDNVSAVILAAGSGSRIGMPKLQLKLGKNTFLTIIAEKFRMADIDKIICVVSEDTYDWAKKEASDLTYVVNPNPDEGMLSSIYLGMKEIGNCTSVVIYPVDHPYVFTETLMRLIHKTRKHTDSVIIPVFNGKRGHPVIVPVSILNFIKPDETEKGLNTILKESGIPEIIVPVFDAGVVRNVNTKKDMR